MRVLVVGVNGLIGSAVAARLAAQGHEVVDVTRRRRRRPNLLITTEVTIDTDIERESLGVICPRVLAIGTSYSSALDLGRDLVVRKQEGIGGIVRWVLNDYVHVERRIELVVPTRSRLSRAAQAFGMLASSATEFV
jgi:NAD(P)-dependent dehydrogenase (short-subunit alcohol dehydrogenase family)